MENRGVLIGSIIFVFASFILMIAALVYESYKAKQMRQLALSIKTETKVVEAAAAQDFSMYKTLVGDDGREMVQISEGPFVMGSRDNDSDPDEKPEHQVYLKAYFIDKNEVTQYAYDRFAKMTKRGKRRIEVFEDDPAKLLKPEYPMIAATWEDAEAYCKWAGKRLPTEAEWEKAARGEGKRRYPWGDEFVVSYANIDGNEDAFRYLAPPGSFESGRSPYGVYDMTGNVGEWVSDFYDENYYRKSPYRDPKGPEQGDQHVIRGGSWRETKRNVRASKRFQAKPWRHDVTVGFRCAKDVDAEGSTK
ncbi:MAG: Sulfatase modifying factor 1 precursor (C-alpha-formyglycine- generating enzyme 1) [Nitrospira sp.]|jgi:formylglycine-generating enzyme required for sulfatase activity|nr:MAG: Sulfatase modifying factor 1 precursor (C-alpha-formyglycine- generating enzyme 1) [Nitrospira sp.]